MPVAPAAHAPRTIAVAADTSRKPALVLDPSERASEVIFGVLMAVSFTGTLSVATAGHGDARTMALAALGSNLAWGLTDGVMYLIDTGTSRNRVVALVRRVRTTPDPAQADALIADAVPDRLAAVAGPNVFEAIRVHLLKLPDLHGGLDADDYRGALGVALLVVVATIPIVVPFVMIDTVTTAMRVSNALALVTLFVSGWVMGRYACGNPWRAGLTMAALGSVLVAAIIALGG
jgi:hypothetical protein